MVKSLIKGGTSIEIWTKDYINNKYMRSDEDYNAQIIQIEHAAYDDYIVEVRRLPKVEEDLQE